MGDNHNHHSGDLQARFITISVQDTNVVKWDNRGMIETAKFPNHLRQFREAAGKSQPELAELAGTSTQNVSRIERGERQLTKKWADIFAPHLGIAPERLIFEDESKERMVPILGLAGAGPNGAVLFAEGQENFGDVPAPPGAGEHVAALEVRGDSMYGLANDGWLLFYEERTEPREEYMGEPCVCWLEDEEQVLVKIPEPTLHPGLYNLTSTNAPTMRSVAVRYMALVTDIRPRRAAQKFIRRNPAHPMSEVRNGLRPSARK
jgi:transcriptional regulator with XRE-family HTH domain